MEMSSEAISDAVIEEAIEVHRQHGPGLLRSFYENALVEKLQRRGLRAERGLAIGTQTGGKSAGTTFYDGIKVEGRFLARVRADEAPIEMHAEKLRAHLQRMHFRSRKGVKGLVVNFWTETMNEAAYLVVCSRVAVGAMTADQLAAIEAALEEMKRSST